MRRACPLIITALLGLMAFFTAGPAFSAIEEPPGGEGKVRVVLFWGEGCPYCQKEKDFMREMAGKYPEIELREYEVWKSRKNAELFREIAAGLGLKGATVPVTFIQNTVFVGFSEEHANTMEGAIKGKIKELKAGEQKAVAGGDTSITLPFLGEFDHAGYSLPLLTVIIGGLDSFNPCALYILMFLMSLVIHARSRARMLLIGGTFVLFSGLIYFLFMSAWLNVFFIAGNLSMITVTAGGVALIVGAVNIKDFFAFGRGVSLAIPEGAKPGLHERMRRLIRTSSTASLLAGTVVLAAAANTYELICTAGFPMVYTRILTLHELSSAGYYIYLMLYNVVYVIPLVAVVAVFIATLGSRKLSEREGRRLKLLSGLMMFYLGLALLVNPELMNNVIAAAGLLVAAVLTSAVVIAVSGRLRPSEGR
jgi:thiol-disulfide isomerase/thioredoxin